MTIELTEHEGCFGITMVAENMQDAATLVRFGMNAVREIRSHSATANEDGSFSAHLVLGKHKRASSYIPRRK